VGEILGTRVKGADGIRAVACLYVVFHHLTQRLNPDPNLLPGWMLKIHHVGMCGEVGVSIFFVLSGCLLSMPFWRNFMNQEPAPQILTYARNRAARIMPGYYLILVLTTVLGAFLTSTSINWPRLGSSVLFINNFTYKTFFPNEVDTPLWSIGLEVWCYILLPLALYWILKFVKSVQGAAIALVAIITGLHVVNPWLISVLMTSSYQKGWQFGLVGGAKYWFPYWNLATFFCQFLLGSTAALFISWRSSKSSRDTVVGDVVGLASITVALHVVLTRLNPGNPDPLTHQPYVAPIFAGLIAIAIAAVSQSLWMWRVFDNPIFRYVAKVSFGLYIWHWFIITLIQNRWAADFTYFGVNGLLRWCQLSVLVLVVSTSLASVSWFYFESRIIRWSRTLSQ
jgi:peptidoglycan/LPS O-acetylase OafA/YrhL